MELLTQTGSIGTERARGVPHAAGARNSCRAGSVLYLLLVRASHPQSVLEGQPLARRGEELPDEARVRRFLPSTYIHASADGARPTSVVAASDRAPSSVASTSPFAKPTPLALLSSVKADRTRRAGRRRSAAALLSSPPRARAVGYCTEPYN